MFPLSEPVISEIIFAMENQTEEFVLVASAQKGVSVVPFSSLSYDSDSAQDSGIRPEDIYSLPKWFSSDGFNLLESFAKSLCSSPVRDELLGVLSNGRGVFKNFKNVLKNHPDIERDFHRFKERKMRSRVEEWYASLRENWSQEKSADGDTLSLCLISDGFSFSRYDRKAESGYVESELRIFSEKKEDELKAAYPGDAGVLLADFWNIRSSRALGEIGGADGFVCRTASDDFVGCLLFSSGPADARESATLTTCFVKDGFHGLGIAERLFETCVSFMRGHGIRTFFVADFFMSESLEKVLFGLGFEKIHSFYVARFF